LTLAAAQLSTGGLFLALAATGRADAAGAWAGAIILAAAILQGKLLLKANQRQRVRRTNPFRRTSFWRTMFVGMVVSYLIALAIGPRPGTAYLFVAALCVCLSITLLPIGVDQRTLDAWQRITRRWMFRRAAAGLTACAMALPAAEITLRGYAWLQ